MHILCGQEHKLRSQNTSWLHGIWPGAEFLTAPALDGVHARRNQRVPAGKGGVFIAVGPKHKGYITNKGIAASGRAVWVHLDLPNCGQVGVLALYAPNDYRERTALWHKLTHLLDKNRPWVIAGDFNMVVSIGDRKGGSGNE